MKTDAAINHFGSRPALAAALGIKTPSVYGWGEYPPEAKQLLIERLTDGLLKAEPGALDRLIGVEKAGAQ